MDPRPQGTGSRQDPLSRDSKILGFVPKCPQPGEAVLFVGLKITFNYLKSFLALQKCTASPGWGHFETNPNILESLEGPEGYLCPGIHNFGVVCI